MQCISCAGMLKCLCKFEDIIFYLPVHRCILNLFSVAVSNPLCHQSAKEPNEWNKKNVASNLSGKTHIEIRERKIGKKTSIKQCILSTNDTRWKKNSYPPNVMLTCYHTCNISMREWKHFLLNRNRRHEKTLFKRRAFERRAFER